MLVSAVLRIPACVSDISVPVGFICQIVQFGSSEPGTSVGSWVLELTAALGVWCQSFLSSFGLHISVFGQSIEHRLGQRGEYIHLLFRGVALEMWVRDYLHLYVFAYVG